VVKENGTLLFKQEFTDILYNDVTDSENNNKGEVKFILEESGIVTYYIYYDKIENSTKSALASSYVINGNFEHSTGTTPTGWTIGQANIGSNAPNNEVHTSEATTVSVTDTGGTNQTKVVENIARTGVSFHLHGYQTRQESGGTQEQTWIEKTFTVSSSNSGIFSYWFNIQGWDQITGNTSYDRFRVYINGTLLNPNSLNISNSSISIFTEAYGKKSSYSTYGDLGWVKASLSLAPYSGTTITVRIEHVTADDNGWKSWQQLDDIEWSLNTGINIGNQEELEAKLVMIKNSCVIFDPINGLTNPKRISGSTIRYSIEVTNSGIANASNVIVKDILHSSFDTSTIRNLQIKDETCNCLDVNSTSNNGVNGTADAEHPIKLDFGTILGTSNTPIQKCGYFEVTLK